MTVFMSMTVDHELPSPAKHPTTKKNERDTNDLFCRGRDLIEVKLLSKREAKERKEDHTERMTDPPSETDIKRSERLPHHERDNRSEVIWASDYMKKAGEESGEEADHRDLSNATRAGLQRRSV